MPCNVLAKYKRKIRSRIYVGGNGCQEGGYGLKLGGCQ
jgi:hypothetical protein